MKSRDYVVASLAVLGVAVASWPGIQERLGGQTYLLVVASLAVAMVTMAVRRNPQ